MLEEEIKREEERSKVENVVKPLKKLIEEKYNINMFFRVHPNCILIEGNKDLSKYINNIRVDVINFIKEVLGKECIIPDVGPAESFSDLACAKHTNVSYLINFVEETKEE